MELSDEDLRKELAKYMDPVPPATGSTREVLRAKLAKFQASKPKACLEASDKSLSAVAGTDDSPERRTSRRQTIATTTTTVITPSTAENLASTTPVRQRSLEKHQVADIASSPSERVFHESNKSRNDSVLYEDSEYRIRYFPSAELPDYPGGLPVFRRRSLHPSGNREAPSDPYEEFYIRSPRLQAKMDAERIISRVMSGTVSEIRSRSTKGRAFYREQWCRPVKRKSWIPLPPVRAFCDFLSYSLLSLFSLLLAPFTLVRVLSYRVCPILGFKTLLFLLIACILTVLGIFFFLSDPFYRNPVPEFVDRISGPLASFLQGGEH
ncbi:Lamino associated polypeptide 2 emerin [Echinococcus multilocularis]|uniref:Lamino associated polypeptide 2 emerin n=1 Tax=Echinococcus multilocularis TaxID=6211 RepID=A0A068Y5H0_ECHMU|nr:Lamino associated polypeptide 2 emerin [Echinococcus multilocularis]